MKTSVLIPTLLKAEEYLDYNIKVLNQQNCNIVLIDNTSNNLTNKYKVYDNVKIFYFPSNIGVNMAWNVGVLQTKSAYILLLNDDCLVWDKVISHSEKILDLNKNIGILTYNTVTNYNKDLYLTLNSKQANEPILRDLKPSIISPGDHRIGWFIYIRRSTYMLIPQELRIFYGDDLLYQYNRKLGYRTVVDMANIIYHQTSTTVNTLSNGNDILNKESKKYKLIEAQKGLVNF